MSNAFDRTVTLNFNSGSEAAIYDALVNFFASGNRVLILYVPKTRGTYSGGYCYDYLSVTAMTLTFTYEYLQSSGSMASSSVAAGSAAKLNITAYNSAYSHRVTWKFGTYSNVQTIAAGGTSASYTMPVCGSSLKPSQMRSLYEENQRWNCMNSVSGRVFRWRRKSR